MKNIIVLLAQRYLFGTAYEKNISTMVRICFISILIGSFALTLVSAIMHGFEITTYEKMQGIHAPIIIRAYGNQIDVNALSSVLKNSFPAVDAFSPINTQYAILESDEGTNVVALKGIDPKKEKLVTNFEKKLEPINGRQPKLEHLIHGNKVVIGKKLADDLQVTIGDTISLLYSESQPRRKKITMSEQSAVVNGIFNTGIEEFDNGLIVSSLSFVQQLYPESGVSQFNLKLKPNSNENATIQQLKEGLNLEVYSWKDLYPALVAALKLEKYAMFFILTLITLVASMNIISLLFMQITQKRSDIAILRAMGAQPKMIEKIFIIMGMTIAITATILGIFLAWIASLILEYYPFITLPDVYYVTHLPAKMEWELVFIVFIVVSCLSFFATWFTARRTRSINIAQILRFEG